MQSDHESDSEVVPPLGFVWEYPGHDIVESANAVELAQVLSYPVVLPDPWPVRLGIPKFRSVDRNPRSPYFAVSESRKEGTSIILAGGPDDPDVQMWAKADIKELEPGVFEAGHTLAATHVVIRAEGTIRVDVLDLLGRLTIIPKS